MSIQAFPTTGFTCNARGNGYVGFFRHGVQDKTGVGVFDALQGELKRNGGDLLSPTGGSQGREVGYLKMFGIGPGDYDKNSFWAKWVVEPFAGWHDKANSYSGYGTVNDPTYTMEVINFDGTKYLDPKTGAPQKPFWLLGFLAIFGQIMARLPAL